MTEDEARALLRDPHAPSLPMAGLTDRERDWLALQPWHETGRGWQVAGELHGVAYHIDVEPGHPRPALYVVSASTTSRQPRAGVWIERPFGPDAAR